MSGVIAGLVAVTPAAGFVGPMGAIVLGAVAGVVCYFFCSGGEARFGYDDSLDVFGIHGVGGIVGSIGTGVFASARRSAASAARTASDGRPGLGAVRWRSLITIVWCGVVSFVLYKLVDMIVGLRVAPETEREGLDLAEHGERAYVH